MKTLWERENLENIESGLQRINVLFTELQNSTQNEILECHNENFTLNHCIRWGLQAVKEILDDDRFWEGVE